MGRSRKTARRARSKPAALYGARIRAWRKLRKLSLQAVADKTGIRKPGISMMERGQQEITLSHLEKLLAALDVSWVEFGLPPPAADDSEPAKSAAAS